MTEQLSDEEQQQEQPEDTDSTDELPSPEDAPSVCTEFTLDDDELADATGTTPEEIERGAEDVDMELVDIEAVPERQPITWGSEQ
jgi:hypothetical protein